MTSFQSLIGFTMLILGSFVGIVSGNPLVILISIIGGFLLLSMSKLIEINLEINHRLLGIPLTKNQIRTIINHSPKYYVETELFEAYPGKEPIYPLLFLDQEYYIRGKVFYKYLSQQDEEYIFELPGFEKIVMIPSADYYRGVDLFELEEQVFVKLSSLGLKVKIVGDRIILA